MKGGILGRYEHTSPAGGFVYTPDVEKGKFVRVKKLQWQISNKTNSNGVSPTLENSNGLEPNNPCNNGCCMNTCLIWILLVCELYDGVMATIQQETIKLNKVSLGSILDVLYFITHASLE
jgi:hypothetical protein